MRVLGSNRETYLQEARRVACSRYYPCPICYKCMEKASHLFVKCQSCNIPLCQHKDSDRKFMIRRNNRAVKVRDDI
jgi:hypothetical protein